MRLVLVSDERGVPLGYTLVPANEKEYEPLADLLSGVAAAIVIGVKGFWGGGYQRRLAADGVALLTPARQRTPDNERRERQLAATRLVIESVFSNLKGQMRLESTLRERQPGSRSGSRNASSRSPSQSCSTPSPAAPHAPSPPTTAAKSHQASR